MILVESYTNYQTDRDTENGEILASGVHDYNQASYYIDNNNGLYLSPNTIYNYSLKPYNALNLPGINYNISICTYCTLNNITSEDFTCYLNYYKT